MKKEIDETFENGWEEMDELRKDMQLTLALKMFDLRTDAYNSGLDDWSDVTVKSVDDSKMRAPMPGSDKREGSESVPKIGTLEVTVTSKGADYRILIRAHYSPSDLNVVLVTDGYAQPCGAIASLVPGMASAGGVCLPVPQF